MLSDCQVQQMLIIILTIMITIFDVIIMTMIFIAMILEMILSTVIMTMRMMRMRSMPQSTATVAAGACRACAAQVKHHASLQLQQFLHLLAGRAWASSQGDLLR